MICKYIACKKADELIIHDYMFELKNIYALVFIEVVFIDVGLKWLLIGKDTDMV